MKRKLQMQPNLGLLMRDSAQNFETRDAIPRPSSFNTENRTVEAVIASAQPVPRQDERGAFHEVLDPAGLDIAASRGASVLDSHQRDGLNRVLGTLDDVRVEGDQVIGTIRFSGRPEIAPMVDDVRAGVIRHLSVGYEVAAWSDDQAGNGMRTRTATKWTIREASFVSIPADRNARTRNAPLPSGRADINRSIRELCSRASVAQHVVDDLIDREATIEDARAVVLDQLVTRGRTSIMTAHNDVTVDNPEVRVRAMSEALYVRVAPGYQPSPQARQYIGLSVAELARECLTRNGLPTTAMSADTIITRALHTTSDFPNILSDVVGKTLRAAYEAAPSGIRRLARETTAADFRTKTRLMLDSTGLTLLGVNEHGEFQSGTMAEAKESYAVDTFGRIFGITRKALVNDDLGAFTDLTRRLGQAAAAFEIQFLVNLLVQGSGLGPLMSDGQRLFHSTHGNVAASGAAPSETTLSAARLAMRKQTGVGGGPVDVVPTFVLVPSELETSTEKLLTQIQATQTSDVNVFAALSLVVEPRLVNATRWYLVADPASMDGLEYAYLAGAPGPQTETQTGFRIDGVEVKIRLDYGAGFVEHRGWYSNAGA
jgi:phage head maturation protease